MRRYIPLFNQGPFLAFVSPTPYPLLPRGPLLSAQRPNLFSTWIGGASADTPHVLVNCHVRAHDVVRMTCITQTMYAGPAMFGLACGFSFEVGMGKAVMCE